ncbi:MAG: nickel pincer cofactor biosynthesis protein LarC [Ferrimicrobium sp.]
MINPRLGVAGDMLVALLISLGADEGYINDRIASVVGDLGVSVLAQSYRAGTISAHQLVVDLGPSVDAHLSIAEMRARVNHSALDRQEAELVYTALDCLEEAERLVHGSEHVVLHELASPDTLIDLVGVAAGLTALHVDRVALGAIPLAIGSIDTAHGIFPNPGPAVTAIAAATGLMVSVVDVEEELTTPTAAAMLGAISRSALFAPFPILGVVRAVGYGAGTQVIPGRANVVQGILIGLDDSDVTGDLEEVAVCEVYVDDLTGEMLGGFVEECLRAGALDAWIQPGLGKKGRPGFAITVLATPEDAPGLVEWLHRRLGTPGVRVRSQQRSRLPPRFVTVVVAGIEVRIKVTSASAKPEFEDLVALVDGLQISLQHARDRVMAAYLGLTISDCDATMGE